MNAPETQQERIARLIAEAKAKIAARQEASPPAPVLEVKPVPVEDPVPVKTGWAWNKEQQQAIDYGVFGKSFVLIGAAGTGKTTTLRGLLEAKLRTNGVPMLETSTQYLASNTPGVALVSFTRRAVRNIARQMPEELKSHCLTIHKLLEFAPEYYEDYNDKGEMVNKVRFVPSRHGGNPLPRELRTIVVDESSMVSLELFDLLIEALPYPSRVQFIFLGDLNQLPPVYGHPILGQKLLQLPIVELTQVYRQALESPIISLALSVKNNNFSQFNKDAVELWSGDTFKKPDGSFSYMGFDAKDIREKIVLERPGRGKVTLHPWKKSVETEVGLAYMQGQLKKWIEDGEYLPDEDLVLCPWNKSFGTDELNRAIADKLAKQRDATVYEVIAGFEKHYFAVGDKLLVDKQECIITEIMPNPKYLGKRPLAPSKDMDRWGNHGTKSTLAEDLANIDIDKMLESLVGDGERVTQSSHILKVRFLDSDEIESIDSANTINQSSFAYAITVHKAQGSECRKVFFLTHGCHSAMLFRELVYTAITRAAEEIYVIMTPMMLSKAGRSPRIKGDTLQAKLDFYRERLKERL